MSSLCSSKLFTTLIEEKYDADELTAAEADSLDGMVEDRLGRTNKHPYPLDDDMPGYTVEDWEDSEGWQKSDCSF